MQVKIQPVVVDLIINFDLNLYIIELLDQPRSQRLDLNIILSYEL